jgi:hypothetical protein
MHDDFLLKKPPMKNTLTTLLIAVATITASAQDFNKNLASAKSSYSSGNLEEARFAMQQMLNDIDIIIGKEIMKLLPSSFDALAADVKNENVTIGSGFAGVVIHRYYGTEPKNVSLDIMTNSPLIASINAMLALPFMANSGDGTQKVVKVHGYKGILQKSVDTDTNVQSFTLQVPLNSSLLTLNGENVTETEILKYANSIPVPQIAKLIQ